MVALGLQIQSNEAIIGLLELNQHGSITQIDCNPKKLALNNVSSAIHLKESMRSIHASLSSFKAERIGILGRQTMPGVPSPSQVGFKLETLIQLFDGVNVEIISPQTIRAFIRKNPSPITPRHKYQNDACNLARYLLS